MWRVDFTCSKRCRLDKLMALTIEAIPAAVELKEMHRIYIRKYL